MAEAKLPRGIVPPGTYAKGARSPIVYVRLCAPCAGYAPFTDEDYAGFLSGQCQGCGAWSRELHRFQALVLSAANGGCMCDTGHPQVTGDLPTEESAGAVMTEVRTRPAPRPAAEQARLAEMAAVPARRGSAEIMCPDSGPCVDGPSPHLWRSSCGPDREGGW